MMFMVCTTCKKNTRLNCIGICYDCQSGKGGLHAFQESSTTELSLCDEPNSCQRVSKGNKEK